VLRQWHTDSSGAQHLFIKWTRRAAPGKLAIDNCCRTRLMPNSLALVAVCGWCMFSISTSQDGHAIRLTVSTASSHGEQPALKISIVRFCSWILSPVSYLSQT